MTAGDGNGTDRPNILLITSDQHRGDCFGFAGRAVQTPHLDALAAAGTRFDACITPNLVCQPARSSILTGLLPLTHGLHDNGLALDKGIGEAGFAGSLAAAGYATALIGKGHFAPAHPPEPIGWPETVPDSAAYGEDWFGPYMGFDHVEMMILGHLWFPPEEPPRGLHYERWFHADGLGTARLAQYRTALPPRTDAAQTWNSALPVARHNTTWAADRAIAWLEARDPGRPFCLWASFADPHHPFDAPAPWGRLHHPDAVDLPPHRTRDLDLRPWWHEAALTRTPRGSADAVRTRQTYSRIAPQTDRQLRAIIANYYGMIALIDHNVGRILAALERLDLDRRTFVVFTADHGDWLGDHGLILKGPMPYEGLLRVGLILRGPGLSAGGVRADPVSTLDLPATFLDWAGASPLGPQHGRSLAPVIGGEESRDHALGEWELLPNRVGVALSLRTVRTARHKLTLELGSGAGELYDLAEDPWETTNRFDDPGCAAVRRVLTDMIRARPDDARPPAGAPIGPG